MLVEDDIDEKSLSHCDCLFVLDPPLATAMVSPDSSMNSALVVTAGGRGGGERRAMVCKCSVVAAIAPGS